MDELLLIDLRRWYSMFRKRYFGNSIPPVNFVVFGLVPGKVMTNVFNSRDCLGFAINGVAQNVAASVIVVSKESNWKERVITLLHEMAHLKIDQKFGRNMGHGKYWRLEMRRLAQIGAFDRYL